MPKTLEEIKGNCLINAAGCWVWQGGASTARGERRAEVTHRLAHRAVWELTRREILKPHQKILRVCRDKMCLNPDHLVKTEGGNPLHGNVRLTTEQVREIRRLYATGDYTQADLAARFGIVEEYVYKITKNRARKDG